ncbi:MAG: tRNA pseudouridine(38-40) synthase TruA [Planctomycetes bacterium]|nr:tRNA pseudouridine(38-40) synthase TruA [Planctomycetota bacterium]
MRNLLITIEYDGTNYFGWQRQADRPTVQGEIERAVSEIFGGDMAVTGASRTDRGVHAYGQIANFKTNAAIPADRVHLALNTKLPADIRVRKCVEVPEEFHARYDAKSKIYMYLVKSSREEPVFDRDRVYHTGSKLDLARMRAAKDSLVGTHDFVAFATKKGETENTERTVYGIKIFQRGEYFAFFVYGKGFLWNQVRTMVGTLHEIGRGYFEVSDAKRILESKDRTKAGPNLPPQGLYLLRVNYRLETKSISDDVRNPDFVDNSLE